MLEVVFTTLKSYFIIVDAIMKIIQYANEYRDYMINALVIVLAFFLGKATRAGNQFDQYLQQFSSSSKDEAAIKARLAFNSKTNKLISAAYFIFVLVLLLLFIYKNQARLVADPFSLDDFLNDLKAQTYNQYIITTFIGSLLVFATVWKYFAYSGGELADKLGRMNSNKQLYVEKFCSIVGTHMKDEIRKCLLKETEPSVLKIDVIAEENANVRAKLKELCLERDQLERTELVYQKFVDGVLEFGWCLKCFEEQTQPECQEDLVRDLSDLPDSKRRSRDSKAISSQTRKVEFKEKGRVCSSAQNLMDVHFKSIGNVRRSEDSKTDLATHFLDNVFPDKGESIKLCRSNCLPKFYVYVQQIAQEAEKEVKHRIDQNN